MWANLKSELGAAVAISAGLLLAAGYAFRWAQIENADLPAQPILSALPTTAFITAAVESLAVPLLVLLTLVIGVVLLRRGAAAFPGWRWWLGFGIAVAICARAAALLDARLLLGWTTATTRATVGVAVAVVVLATLGGTLVAYLMRSVSDTGRILQTLAAVMLVLTIVAASAFRVADAATVDSPLPSVGVFLDTEDCPPVLDVNRIPVASTVAAEGDGQRERVVEKRCYVGGFYVGESDQWMFVAEPRQGSTPGRLLLVPRDAAKLTAVSEEELAPSGKAED